MNRSNFSLGVLLLFNCVSSAQMVNSGATVSVAQGTTFGIDMDFLNTGSLKNQGDIFLTGNWMNVGTYDSAGGQLVFSSSEVQEIMNNGERINNLVIRNGIKTLSDDLTITGQLSLNSGILQIKEEAKLTLGQGVLITGAGADAYIEGRVFRIGTGDLFFPIGASGNYLPAILKNVTGTNPSLGLRVYADAPEQALGGSLETLATSAYWNLESDESYTGGLIALPAETTDDPRLVVAQATSEDGLFESLGKFEEFTENEVNYFSSQGNALGPFFALAFTPEDAPLPPLKVVNVITPLQDGKHDYLRIENIELYPDNRVEIFDRHGNKVFSLKDYNNRDRVFVGEPNSGISGELPDGNYFYTIKTGRTKVTSGFLFLKR
ncbi:MAG: gliding motility-associated C-terminal domain-containing protein [Bacteroidota bacterium]